MENTHEYTSRNIRHDGQRKLANSTALPLQAGYLGSTSVPDKPASIKPWLIQGLTAKAVAAGRRTAAALGTGGQIYTWGGSELARPVASKAEGSIPGVVDGIWSLDAPEHAVKVCMGEYHGVALTASGKVRALDAVRHLRRGRQRSPCISHCSMLHSSKSKQIK